MQSFAVDAIAERHRHWFFKKWDMFTAYLENYRQCIFYIFVFYVITFALFIERFVYYAFMAEHRLLFLTKKTMTNKLNPSRRQIVQEIVFQIWDI